MSKLISVISGKGGVGKSTLASNLAKSLANLSKRALLVELDFGLRGLDIIFGVEDNVVYDIGDVLSGSVDLSSAVVECSEYVDLLSASSSNELLYKSLDLEKLVSEANDSYDFIIFDCPAGLGKTVIESSEFSDISLLVTIPEPICVRDAAKLVTMLDDTKNVKLIINQVNKKKLKKSTIGDLDTVIDSTGVQLLGVVPEDDIIRDFPIGAKQHKATVTQKAFDNIAKRICGEYIPLAVE